MGAQWNEPGLLSSNGLPICVLKQILHGNLDLNPVTPTFNPNLMRVGILLFLKFVITWAEKLSFSDRFKLFNISLKLILII